MTGPQADLALTLIVRDEAARIARFLAHHHDLVDEIIVVDTGSTDGTPDLCRAAGARVVNQPWTDDFAAARNVGLDVVNAAWAVFLDADEQIATADFAALREIAAGPADHALLMETWNYCPEGTHLEWRPLFGRYPSEESGQEGLFVARRIGMFPSREGLRFSGRVHESVLPAVEEAGLAVRRSPVPVHHFGYVAGPEVNDARRARYRRLVQQKFAEDPSDPAGQLEWASVLLEDGEVPAATEILARLADGPEGLRPVVRGTVLLGRLQREAGDLRAARNLLLSARTQDPDFAFAWLEALRTEAAAGEWAAAQTLLDEAELRFGATEPVLQREAVRVRIQNRELAAALEAAEELARTCPAWQDMHELAARLRRMTGR